SSTTGSDSVDAASEAEAGPPPIQCGNGIREGSEQCDDGNSLNLDGCDANCRFEQLQRVNWFKLQSTTDANCSTNAFGRAVQPTLRTTLQSFIDASIKDGSISILLQALGLSDLTGTNADSFQIGLMGAAPMPPVAPVVYDGTNDLDWWYDISPAS